VQCLHQTADRTTAQLLRGALESEGIEVVVQGEHATAAAGELPVGASAVYRVCLVDDEQLPRASRLVRAWLDDRREGPSGETWHCAACGERCEPQFRSCWRCGAEAP
jgi:hypothetical protein